MPRLQILKPWGEHTSEAFVPLSPGSFLTTNTRRFAPAYPGVAVLVQIQMAAPVVKRLTEFNEIQIPHPQH